MYCLSNWSCNENKTISQQTFVNFVAVAIVSVIVLGHPFNKSRRLTGSNRILLCLNRSSQISKACAKSETASSKINKIIEININVLPKFNAHAYALYSCETSIIISFSGVQVVFALKMLQKRFVLQPSSAPLSADVCQESQCHCLSSKSLPQLLK